MGEWSNISTLPVLFILVLASGWTLISNNNIEVSETHNFLSAINFAMVPLLCTVKCNCWWALARQLPILYNSENKAKSVGCKIEDMRSRLCFLYPSIPGHLWMHVEILIYFEQ